MVVVWFSTPVHQLSTIKNINNLIALFLVESVSNVKQQAQNITMAVTDKACICLHYTALTSLYGTINPITYYPGLKNVKAHNAHN